MAHQNGLTAEQVYDTCGSLFAAKEKNREEVGSLSMGEFVSLYFEQTFSPRVEAQKKLGIFARAIQTHWPHPELGARIHTFGILCGLLLMEGDTVVPETRSCLGASPEACDLVLDALRAVLNAPRYIPVETPEPNDTLHLMKLKPWREKPTPLKRPISLIIDPSSSNSPSSMNHHYPAKLNHVLRYGCKENTSVKAPLCKETSPNEDFLSQAETNSRHNDHEEESDEGLFSYDLSSYCSSSSSSSSVSSSSSLPSLKHKSEKTLSFYDQGSSGDGRSSPHRSRIGGSENSSHRRRRRRRKLCRGIHECTVLFRRDEKRTARAMAISKWEETRLNKERNIGKLVITELSTPSSVVDMAVISTAEGRLRQVLTAIKMPSDSIDALLDTLWAETINGKPCPIDNALEAQLPLDVLMERVLTVWVIVCLTQREIDRQKEQERIRLELEGPKLKLEDMDWSALGGHSSNSSVNSVIKSQNKPFQKESVDRKTRKDKNDNDDDDDDSLSQKVLVEMKETNQQGGKGGVGGGVSLMDNIDPTVESFGIQDEDDIRALESVQASIDAHAKEVSSKLAAIRAKEKAKEDQERAEVIRYAEPTACCIDWNIVFDGDGNEISFEEARALYHTLRCSSSLTLTVRFLTRPPTTVRCAPKDTVAMVKDKVLIAAKLKKKLSLSSSSSSASSSSSTNRNSQKNSNQNRNKNKNNNESNAGYVMVLNGCEMFEESTMEACGLHNNASVEMVELDVWSGMLAMRLDAPSNTRQKIGAVGAAMNKVKLPTPPTRHLRSLSSSASNNSAISASSSTSSTMNKKGHLVSFGIGRGEMPTPHPPDPKFMALLQSYGNPKVLQSKRFKASTPINETGISTPNSAHDRDVGTVSNAMVNLKLKLKTGGKGWQPPFDTY